MYEIEKRRSARAFSGEKAGSRQIERIMEAAHLAPSCFNNQPWRFVVYQSEQELENISQVLSKNNYWAKKSAFIVAAVTRGEDDCQLSDNRGYALFDTGLAVENMMLQAIHEGLFAHPMAGFDPLKVKDISQIPEDFTVIALVAFGVPGDVEQLEERHQQLEENPRSRKPLNEIVFNGSWGH
ncbi:MAG: nitroreductase family protein [Spirochaetales bacterium]|nr:nitroreductase family protein [Spirochaetales bacterium]